MAEIKKDVPKVFGYILFVVCMQCIHVKSDSDASSYNFKSVNFEQFKTDLFTSNFNISSENNAECFEELNAIKNGFANSEQWTFQS